MLLKLVDLLSRSTRHSATFGDLQVDSDLYWVLGKFILVLDRSNGKAGSVLIYSSILSFRGFVDVCTWFCCVLRSCGRNIQVLYINLWVYLCWFVLMRPMWTCHNCFSYMHSKNKLEIGSLGPLGLVCLSVLMGFDAWHLIYIYFKIPLMDLNKNTFYQLCL